MTSRVRGRMGSKKGLADMSLPAEERHRKRRSKGKGKGVIAQMDHGNGSKANKRRREFKRKHGRARRAADSGVGHKLGDAVQTVRGAGDMPNGFRFTPRGPFQVRNYDGESLPDLEPVHEHVDALIENHKMLIPGSMMRLMHQWRDDLWTAIEAHAKKDAECESVQSEQGQTNSVSGPMGTGTA